MYIYIYYGISYSMFTHNNNNLRPHQPNIVTNIATKKRSIVLGSKNWVKA